MIPGAACSMVTKGVDMQYFTNTAPGHPQRSKQWVEFAISTTEQGVGRRRQVVAGC